jgi:hypothetical protein
MLSGGSVHFFVLRSFADPPQNSMPISDHLVNSFFLTLFFVKEEGSQSRGLMQMSSQFLHIFSALRV